MARVTVRLPDSTLAKLDALATGRGLTRARLVRQLVDAEVSGAPAPHIEPPSEDELLDLLAKKARQGNVAAIRSLLGRMDETDPRTRALAALETMAEDRRQ